MAVATDARPTPTRQARPTLAEIDEALTWTSLIPRYERDRYWRTWADRLLDTRLRITHQ